MTEFNHRLHVTIKGEKPENHPPLYEGNMSFNWVQQGLPIPRRMVKHDDVGPDYLVQSVKEEDVVEMGRKIHVTRAEVVPQVGNEPTTR